MIPAVIASNLPALQIVIPLIGAPLCLLLGNRRVCWLLAMVISWAIFATSVALLDQVLSSGVISYHLGGWEPPWGIEYRIDEANAFMLLIIAAINLVILPFARQSVEAEIEPERGHLFYALYLLCQTGLMGIAITGDAFNAFVFLEISSLSTYALIALGKDRRALRAAFQYLIMGTIGATFYLIGVGLLYAMTGTLNMADLAARVPGVAETRTVEMALVFLTIGIGLKAAIFPLHLWLPNAYCYAPSVVTAFLAATATKVSIYLLLRIFFTIFGFDFALGAVPLIPLLSPFALAAILVASTVAIFQTDAKRLLAYSSVAQIGYMVLGIALVSTAGISATMVHLFNHALIKGALFLALGAVFLRLGSVKLDDMAGLATRMPWTMAAIVAGGMSLIGVPLTTGFVSKWVLVQATLEDGHWYFAVLVLFASLLALIYVWRIAEAAYFKPPSERAAAAVEAPLGMLIPTWILVGANVYFGVDTDLTLGVARDAANTLLGLPT